MYYKPDPDKAYESIQYITNDLAWGWLVRGMHRWGASVFIILLFLHMGRVFLFGAYKYPRELNWLIGVLLLALGMFEGFTGYLLPWDQTAYWATVVGININGTGPFVGPLPLEHPARRLRDRLGDARALLLDPHAADTRRPHCAHRAAPLSRRAPRRQLASLVEDAAGRERQAEVDTRKQGLLEPRPRGNGDGGTEDGAP